MALIRISSLLILFLAVFVSGRQLNFNHVRDSDLVRALKEISGNNQNNTMSESTLDLPANASSIRENITDTFSCENRTYGYYADVDNDCQVFHVCLPSQTPSGRNVTYRWSFICPSQTVFNQEVLTCTRTLKPMECKDAPLFYHLNMEIGKEPNKTAETTKQKQRNRTIPTEKKKENVVLDNFVIQNVIADMVHDELNERRKAAELKQITTKDGPMLIEGVIENIEPDVEDTEERREEESRKEEEIDRIVMERNMRAERQMKRGAARFSADAY